MSHGCNQSSNRVLAFVKKYPWLFPFTGLIALVWFLVRVIPKPSRALYPCQQIVTPIASGFIAWIIGSVAGIFPSVVVFKIGKKRLKNARYAVAIAFFAAAMVLYAGFLFVRLPMEPASAENVPFIAEAANQPLGVARGVKPGRVVWVHDPGAVKYTGTGTWWDDKNILQAAVDGMMEDAVLNLAGTETLSDAWDALFRNFNQSYGRGDQGYQAGEKIAIKLNMNKSTRIVWQSNFKQFVTTPQTTNALVKQLIDVVGVAGADITVYDASRCVGKPVVDKIRSNEGQDYQNVNFVINPAFSAEGYLAAVHDENHPIVFADSTMEDYNQTYLPTCVTEASYLISFGTFKGHTLAGVTLCAKNFFGSVYRPATLETIPQKMGWSPSGTDTGEDGMQGIHYYINPFRQPTGNTTSVCEMGSYNAFVDIMGHEHLGGKVVLCLIDGLYSSVTQHANITKWQSAPFNNDWTSSIFASQDFVAIESVCMDFLVAEPTMIYNLGALDNYLHEGAQANAPPSGTFYDPEGDGTPLKSLGAHEHWNNADDKQYSRNLGTGEGIELFKVARDSKPPKPPSNIKSTVGPAKVILTWDSCGEGVTYTVKREKDSEGSETIAMGLTECRYDDEDVTAGNSYKYAVYATNIFGAGENSIEVIAEPIEPLAVEDGPEQFEIGLSNFPNPFNPSTRLSYTVPDESHNVSLMVFNLLGQRVVTLIDTNLSAGRYATNWNGMNDVGERASAGVYIVRLMAGNNVKTRKISLIY